MDTTQIGQAVQIAVLIVAALGIIASIRGVIRQIQVATYMEFTKRFGEIARRLSRLLLKFKGETKLDNIPSSHIDEVMEAIDDYFGILATEFHLSESKDIDPRTWEVWSSHIPRVLRNPLVREGWFRVKEQYVLVRNFEQFIETKLTT